MSLQAYVRGRARMQRLSDAKLFNAWLQGVLGLELYLESDEPTDVVPGQELYVQVAGPSLSAHFNSCVTLVSGSQIRMRVVPPIRYLAATEDARVRADGIVATVERESESFDVAVVDASRHGIGIASPVAFERGESITLTIVFKGLSVTATAEVRYCRADKKQEGKFRIGLLISDLKRLEQAKWSRLLSEFAA
ncbi:MAG: PilZ domain-containing protein [Armatimonadetes bacterium]|nr:PilZ domain-containing protein [Armatimonadota bacterium]